MNKLPSRLKKRSITLTLPPNLLKDIRERAKMGRCSQSALVSRALALQFTRVEIKA